MKASSDNNQGVDIASDENASGNRCHNFEAEIGPFRLSFNPVVTICSAIVIWLFVIVAISIPNETMKAMVHTKNWISFTFTWLYISTRSIWVIFIGFVYFSKYSQIKLGKDDDEPEFSDLSYFTMLFAAGVGIGLFYYGVAEPVLHYEPGNYGNRYWDRYSDNQRAQDAMNLTFFHWGLHGWVGYVIIGVLLAYVGFRKGLPMTVRSCFYPLVGDSVYGLLGDFIDILSIIGTMFGVCTSLGMGVMTLNAGLHRVNNNISVSITSQVIIIWIITAMATASVISGLKLGIRRLSEICFALGMFLCLFILFQSDTWYFLNIFIQSFGYYLQYIVQIGTHTDAFAHARNAPDGKENPNWMGGWTIFYWGWWISWCPFVGMFIAKISRGRTIRNFLNYTLTAPMIYTFFWFSIFGGAGLDMERNAANNNITCSSLLGGKNSTESYNGLYRLSCRGDTDMLFDVMQGFDPNLSSFLCVITIISLTLYFVTSSDSGSLVIDCLSANGSPDPPVLQRIFWALTEGACATALLTAGGEKALGSLQSVSIAAGLPYTIVVCFMCVALWRALTTDDIEPDPRKYVRGFECALFHVFATPLSLQKFIDLALCLIMPWWSAGRVSGYVYNQSPTSARITMALLFNCWAILEILQVVQTGLAYIGWVILIGFFTYVVSIRAGLREKFGIDGNIFQDFLIVIFLYPFAVDQMSRHLKFEIGKKHDSKIVLDDLGASSTEKETFITI